jgi:GNAT superfamily N-acetyltransferase
MDEYKITKCTPENVHNINVLFKEARSLIFPNDFYKKKNETFFTGTSYHSFIAFDANNAPSAHCGCYATLIEINNKKEVALQFADVITHPKHQKKGLFAALGKAAEKYAIEKNINYLFAIPNEQSEPGFIRSLNWDISHQMNVYSFKVKGFPIAKIFAKLRLNSIYNYCWLSPITKIFKFKNLDLNWSSSEKNFIIKNKEYFNYKEYNSNFIVKYKSLVMFIKIEGGLYVGDVSINRNINAISFLNKVKSFARLIGQSNIRFEVTPGSHLDYLLNQNQEPLKGLNVTIKSINKESSKFKLNITAADYDTF